MELDGHASSVIVCGILKRSTVHWHSDDSLPPNLLLQRLQKQGSPCLQEFSECCDHCRRSLLLWGLSKVSRWPGVGRLPSLRPSMACGPGERLYRRVRRDRGGRPSSPHGPPWPWPRVPPWPAPLPRLVPWKPAPSLYSLPRVQPGSSPGSSPLPPSPQLDWPCPRRLPSEPHPTPPAALRHSPHRLPSWLGSRSVSL